MADRTEPDTILYDLGCTKNVCFSPTVWRIRLMLNYKNIPGVAPPESGSGKYTVPTIKHNPTGKYIMDSAAKPQFLESTYPDLPVPLTSELGRDIEDFFRARLAKTFGFSIAPREVNILSPQSAAYFRERRESEFGHPLEKLLNSEEEEQRWFESQDSLYRVGQMILTNKADGTFVLGAKPSYTDFFLVGTLQTARVIHEKTFERIVSTSGYREVWDACLPWM